MAGFGEHGREGARELVNVPVVDITEAAAHLACLLGRRYGVVTTLERSRGQIEDSLYAAGVAQNCAAVVGTGLGVLDLGDVQRTQEAFVTAAERAREAGAEVLVLGCAGMTGLQRAVGEKLDLPVVDGVAAAVKLAESLVSWASGRAGWAAMRDRCRSGGCGAPAEGECGLGLGFGLGLGHDRRRRDLHQLPRVPEAGHAEQRRRVGSGAEPGRFDDTPHVGQHPRLTTDDVHIGRHHMREVTAHRTELLAEIGDHLLGLPHVIPTPTTFPAASSGTAPARKASRAPASTTDT